MGRNYGKINKLQVNQKYQKNDVHYDEVALLTLAFGPFH